MIECRRCANKNSDWKVIKSFPLQDISDKLPKEYKNNGFKEFYCSNIIEKRRVFEILERECGTHILISYLTFKKMQNLK